MHAARVCRMQMHGLTAFCFLAFYMLLVAPRLSLSVCLSVCLSVSVHNCLDFVTDRELVFAEVVNTWKVSVKFGLQCSDLNCAEKKARRKSGNE